MKTDAARKVTLKIVDQEAHENLKVRRTLGDLQHASTDKENLVGRSCLQKGGKLSTQTIKQMTFSEKGSQTEVIFTAEDLTTGEPSADYWKRIAEKRSEYLDDSFRENERLKAENEALQEENKICKAMLDEATTLVEILKEELLGSDEEPGETEKND